MLRLVISIIVITIFSSAAVFAKVEPLEHMRNKAIERFGEAWVKDIESWTKTLQENTPAIKPFQPQRNSPKNSLDLKHLVNRFIDVTSSNQSITLAPKTETLIFVSTSLTPKSLQQWARQADKINASLIIRGFVNNSMKETVRVTQEIFGKQDVGGFSVDPEKFKDFNIKKVPAVVINFTPICNKEDCPPLAFDVVYGNIGLLEALKLIATKGSTDGQKYASELINVYKAK